MFGSSATGMYPVEEEANILVVVVVIVVVVVVVAAAAAVMGFMRFRTNHVPIAIKVPAKWLFTILCYMHIMLTFTLDDYVN